MFPDDRVLVGVIKRKKDLKLARNQHWYRIPQARMQRGVHAEYLAFFLSGKVAGQPESGIYYFAERAGLELAYRRDLLPDEADKPTANEVYYKVQLRNWQPKTPPVLNTTNRAFSFIHTTWDRFVHAREIRDLYSDADYYVDRIYHALRTDGLTALERYWDGERRETGHGAQLRILCERGVLTASADPTGGDILLESGVEEDEILAKIRAAVARQGGPVMVNIPLD